MINELPLLKPDDDAYYSKTITIDLASIEPYVSGPNTVKKMTKVSEIEDKKVKIDKAYVVSCVNSRYEDLVEAAEVLKGNKIAEHVKFYVAAASSEIKKKPLNRDIGKFFLMQAQLNFRRVVDLVLV